MCILYLLVGFKELWWLLCPENPEPAFLHCPCVRRRRRRCDAHAEQQEQAMGHGWGDVRRAAEAKRRECQLVATEAPVHRITAWNLLDAEPALRELSLANSPPKLLPKEPQSKHAPHNLQGDFTSTLRSICRSLFNSSSVQKITQFLFRDQDQNADSRRSSPQPLAGSAVCNMDRP